MQDVPQVMVEMDFMAIQELVEKAENKIRLMVVEVVPEVEEVQEIHLEHKLNLQHLVVIHFRQTGELVAVLEVEVAMKENMVAVVDSEPPVVMEIMVLVTKKVKEEMLRVPLTLQTLLEGLVAEEALVMEMTNHVQEEEEVVVGVPY